MTVIVETVRLANSGRVIYLRSTLPFDNKMLQDPK